MKTVSLALAFLVFSGCSSLHVSNALRSSGVHAPAGADDAACREEAKAALHPRNWHGGPPAGYSRSAGDVTAGVAVGLVNAPAGLGLLALADARGFTQGYDGARAMQNAEREPVVARYIACMAARGHTVTR